MDVKAKVLASFKKIASSSVGDPSSFSDWKNRPTYLGRMASRFIDLCVLSILLSPITTNISPAQEYVFAVLLLLVPFYYFVFEWFVGRTVGKMVMGYKIAILPGSRRTRMVFLRLALRLFTVVMFFVPALISWRRVSLLDLCSRVRISKATNRTSRLRAVTPAPGFSLGSLKR